MVLIVWEVSDVVGPCGKPFSTPLNLLPLLLLFFKLGNTLGLVGTARLGPAVATMVATMVLAQGMPMLRLGLKVIGGGKNEEFTDLPSVRGVGL